MKKTICILLSLVLALTGLFGLGMTSSAVYNVGDTISFGSYPQTRVTDSGLLSSLNAVGGTWYSYNYNGTDCMKYKDVAYNGANYRCVTINSNRPISMSYSNTQQDNGYTIGSYWFKIEPLQWRVLDPSTGFILCSTVIDAQPFSDTGSGGSTYFASNYEKSYIRTWLNGAFFNAAFSSAEKARIQTTAVETKSAFSSTYDVATTNDKVFLLSKDEVTNKAYGFSRYASTRDVKRQLKGTDYARCQGLWYYHENADEKTGPSHWWLRTPYTKTFSCYVENTGVVNDMDYVTHTNIGVCPAIKIGDLNAGITVNSVAIQTMPAKTVYNVGESFDDSGLTLNVTYSDGDTVTITDGIVCTGFNSATPGISTVTVSYGGKSTTFNVTIKPAAGSVAGIAIKSMPNKTVYTYRNDKDLDLAGLEVEVTYTDNSKSPIDPAACTITGYSAKPAGDKTITVEYEGQTTQFNVTVKYAWWQWLIRIFLLGFIWY